MLDTVKVFWDLFFYPLFNVETITEFFYVVSACLVCLAVSEFVGKVLSECM